jgi:hypothetical protein
MLRLLQGTRWSGVQLRCVLERHHQDTVLGVCECCHQFAVAGQRAGFAAEGPPRHGELAVCWQSSSCWPPKLACCRQVTLSLLYCIQNLAYARKHLGVIGLKCSVLFLGWHEFVQKGRDVMSPMSRAGS